MVRYDTWLENIFKPQNEKKRKHDGKHDVISMELKFFFTVNYDILHEFFDKKSHKFPN